METKLSSNLSHEKVDELQSELYIAHKQLEQQKKIVAKYRELKAKEKDSDVVCMYVCIYVCVFFDSYLVYLCMYMFTRFSTYALLSSQSALENQRSLL